MTVKGLTLRGKKCSIGLSKVAVSIQVQEWPQTQATQVCSRLATTR